VRIGFIALRITRPRADSFASPIDSERRVTNNAEMSHGDTTTTEPSGDGRPTPRDVLRWCADAAPELWFPSAQAQLAGIPRDNLDEPLLVLRQAGLVRVGDWVRGQGQGFAITPAGRETLAEPDRPIVPPPDEMPRDEEARPEPPADTGLTAYDRGELTREAFLAQRPAVVTPVLIFANAAWFVAGLATAWQMGVPNADYLEGKNRLVLLRIGAAFGPNLLAGEWWRLLSCGLVHIGVLHLFVNLFSLAMVGQVVERLWGRWRFVVLYALSGLAGACLAMAVQPRGVLAGASGSIWGLLLAVVAWLIRYRQHLPPEVVSLWLRRLVLVIGVNALISLIPQVSWEAHLGGALSGFAAAVFLDMTRAGAGRRSNLLGVAGLFVILAVAVGGLGLAVRYSPRWQQLRQQMAVFPIRAPAGELMESAREAQTLINTSLKPERVKAVRYNVTIALIVHSPKSVEAAQAEVRQLREDADRAAELLPAVSAPKILLIRAYLGDVERFAGLMARQLASGQAPTSDEWQAINAQLEKVEQGWIASTQE
jgi:membrane associated rhomboid family serine protease